jgi:threonine synthase
MKYYSLHKQSPVVDFKEATIRGQAPDKGLYFPETIPQLPQSFIKEIETLSNEEIAYRIIKPYVGETIQEEELRMIVAETINFSIPLVQVTDKIHSLELFHGPTLAFKDVGARFMSRCLSHFAKDNNQKIIVLVATSGDTGGAVAHSFYGAENIDVVILYPSGKVSPLQEKQLTTLGKNIHALEIEGNFDDCQQLVKQAFADVSLTQKIFLTSANSINVARWLPQQFYYAFAWKQWPLKDSLPVISVPSGNFGNICAGILAHLSGIPVKHFIAACNANDIIPAYFTTGLFPKKAAVATASNAMDVANPSNFIRVMELFDGLLQNVKRKVSTTSTDDAITKQTIRKVYAGHNYILDPHSAVAWNALENYLQERPGEKGIIISTAHPVKFPEIVEQEVGRPVSLPDAVQGLMNKPSLKTKMEVSYDKLKAFLVELS